MLTSGAKTHRVCATSLAALLLLSYIFAVVAARAVEEDTGVGPPPALAPGQAPPLPKPGPLAEPRLSTQVGFPTVLTKYVISPSTLRPARVALGQKLFFEPRLSGDGTVACATCHDPDRAFTDGRPVSVGIHGRVGQRNAPTVLNALSTRCGFSAGSDLPVRCWNHGILAPLADSRHAPFFGGRKWRNVRAGERFRRK